MAASTRLTPEQRSERARKAALARTSIEAHVKAVVDRAPELDADQLDRLALILRGGGPR